MVECDGLCVFNQFPIDHSKFAPTHGVEHHIESNDVLPVRSSARPLFGTKKKAATILATGIVSRCEGSRWAAPCTSSRSRMEAGAYVVIFAD